MKPVWFLPLLMGLLLVTSACGSSAGTVRENFQEAGYTLEFTKWGDQSKHDLSLDANDELQISIFCETGSIALDIRGKDGTEAYTGNGLKTGTFTVKVSEAGDYVVTVKGDAVTGRMEIKNLSR